MVKTVRVVKKDSWGVGIHQPTLNEQKEAMCE
jgi:hypothetical protein